VLQHFDTWLQCEAISLARTSFLVRAFREQFSHKLLRKWLPSQCGADWLTWLQQDQLDCTNGQREIVVYFLPTLQYLQRIHGVRYSGR